MNTLRKVVMNPNVVLASVLLTIIFTAVSVVSLAFSLHSDATANRESRARIASQAESLTFQRNVNCKFFESVGDIPAITAQLVSPAGQQLSQTLDKVKTNARDGAAQLQCQSQP